MAEPNRFQKLAHDFSRAFERKTRESGETFVKLREGSPEWMTDAIREAHGVGGSLMLPDDWRYVLCERVADQIADSGAEDADKAREACDEIEPDVYTGTLCDWLASHVERVGYCDEAAEEYGAGLDTIQRIGTGQLMEIREVAASLIASLEAEAEGEEEEREPQPHAPLCSSRVGGECDCGEADAQAEEGE